MDIKSLFFIQESA